MKNIFFTFDPLIFTEESSLFLRDILSQAETKNIIIAVSGGVDSAVALALSARAVPADNIYTIHMPCGQMNVESSIRAQELVRALNIPNNNNFSMNIKEMVDLFSELQPDELRLGNIIARIRMIVLFDMAKKFNALVLGTENRSEYHLGYFTRFGDEASDIELIRSLYKTSVYKLAEHLGIANDIVVASPSAELWAGQTDESELGFSYIKTDPILYLLSDKGYSVEQIEEEGFDKKDILAVKARVDSASFKHHVPHVFNP